MYVLEKRSGSTDQAVLEERAHPLTSRIEPLLEVDEVRTPAASARSRISVASSALRPKGLSQTTAWPWSRRRGRVRGGGTAASGPRSGRRRGERRARARLRRRAAIPRRRPRTPRSGRRRAPRPSPESTPDHPDANDVTHGRHTLVRTPSATTASPRSTTTARPTSSRRRSGSRLAMTGARAEARQLGTASCCDGSHASTPCSTLGTPAKGPSREGFAGSWWERLMGRGSGLRHGGRRALEAGGRLRLATRSGIWAAIVAPLVLSFVSCAFGPIVKDRNGRSAPFAKVTHRYPPCAAGGAVAPATSPRPCSRGRTGWR